MRRKYRKVEMVRGDLMCGKGFSERFSRLVGTTQDGNGLRWRTISDQIRAMAGDTNGLIVWVREDFDQWWRAVLQAAERAGLPWSLCR